MAKLVAGDKLLEPRLRLLADEQLTGAARDKVQARLDLWLKAHVERLLGPLLELDGRRGPQRAWRGASPSRSPRLSACSSAPGSRDEMKSLDQEARSRAAQLRRTLRRLPPLSSPPC